MWYLERPPGCDFFPFNFSQKESKGEAPQTGFYSLYWPVLVIRFQLFNMLLIIHFSGGVSLGKAFKNTNNQWLHHSYGLQRSKLLPFHFAGGGWGFRWLIPDSAALHITNILQCIHTLCWVGNLKRAYSCINIWSKHLQLKTAAIHSFKQAWKWRIRDVLAAVKWVARSEKTSSKAIPCVLWQEVRRELPGQGWRSPEKLSWWHGEQWWVRAGAWGNSQKFISR